VAKIKAHELTEVSVRAISLVDRGAIRQPFKIMKRDASQPAVTKGDKPMKLLRTLKNALATVTGTTAPSILAVVAAKAADQEAVKAYLEKAGLSAGTVVEHDDLVVYKQEGAPEDLDELGDGNVVLKLDNNLALVVSNKEFAPWNVENPTFAEAAQMQGVYPSVDGATEVLKSMVWSGLNKASSPDEAAQNIAKAFDDAKSYFSKLVGSMPSQAFKFEAIAKGDKMFGEKKPKDKDKAKDKEVEKSAAPEGCSQDKWDAMSADEKAAYNEKHKQKADATDDGPKGPVDTASGSERTAPKKTEKSPVKETAKSDGATLEDVLKAVNGLAATVKEQGAQITEVVDGVDELGARIEKGEKSITAVKAALRSTVNGTEPGEETGRSVRARKSSDALEGGCIDTALSPIKD